MVFMEALRADASKVVGTKQVLRALSQGRARVVYLAQDADAAIRDQVQAACQGQAVPLEPVASMKILGEACGIAVGAAVACTVAQR